MVPTWHYDFLISSHSFIQAIYMLVFILFGQESRFNTRGFERQCKWTGINISSVGIAFSLFLSLSKWWRQCQSRHVLMHGSFIMTFDWFGELRLAHSCKKKVSVLMCDSCPNQSLSVAWQRWWDLNQFLIGFDLGCISIYNMAMAYGVDNYLRD